MTQDTVEVEKSTTTETAAANGASPCNTIQPLIDSLIKDVDPEDDDPDFLYTWIMPT
jgi:hypothetical protein